MKSSKLAKYNSSSKLSSSANGANEARMCGSAGPDKLVDVGVQAVYRGYGSQGSAWKIGSLAMRRLYVLRIPFAVCDEEVNSSKMKDSFSPSWFGRSAVGRGLCLGFRFAWFRARPVRVWVAYSLSQVLKDVNTFRYTSWATSLWSLSSDSSPSMIIGSKPSNVGGWGVERFSSMRAVCKLPEGQVKSGEPATMKDLMTPPQVSRNLNYDTLVYPH